MKIGLLDVDSHNFPNLPLMKLSAWHKKQGHEVELFFALNKYDKVYLSKIFDFTPDYQIAINADEIVHGGTGYNLTSKLPHQVENIYPDYSLYPNFDEAYGFLTRGCPRQCHFCIVSQKEGKQSYQVAELKDFWKDQKTIKLLDPNLLACSNRYSLLESLVESKAYIDFTQGLDIRLIDDQCIKLIIKLKTKMIHFAWDNPKEDLTSNFEQFKRKSKIDRRKLGVYILTNFNSTHKEDLFRIYTLKELGYDPYVMIFDKYNAPRRTRLLQRWVNNKRVFRVVDRFEDYDCKLA